MVIINKESNNPFILPTRKNMYILSDLIYYVKCQVYNKIIYNYKSLLEPRTNTKIYRNTVDSPYVSNKSS